MDVANYEISYEFIFEWLSLSSNHANRTQIFQAESDEVAKNWAEQFIAERNRLGEDGGDNYDFRGDQRVRRKGHDFKMTRLIKIVE
jgi:hypothetical protein